MTCPRCDGEGEVPCPSSNCLGGDVYDGITGAARCCRTCRGAGTVSCECDDLDADRRLGEQREAEV